MKAATRGRGVVAITAAAALWAVAAVVARGLFERGVSPLELCEARAWIAALGLGVVHLFRGGPTSPTARRTVVFLGLSLALVNATYMLAIERLAVAVAVVVQYTAPALVVGWTALYRRRLPKPVLMMVTAAAMAGVLLVSGVPGVVDTPVDPLGMVFAGASAVLFAAYTLLARPAAAAYGPMGAVTRAFAVAALFWIVVQAPFGAPQTILDPTHAIGVGYVGVFGTLAPFWLYVWGVRQVAPEAATIVATLEPVLAAAAAWIVLNQHLAPSQIAGGLLVVGAVIVLDRIR